MSKTHVSSWTCEIY